MADTTKDLLKSDPIGTLQTASKLSLQGGGILLFAVLAAVYKMNVAPKWQIDSKLVLVALIGAVLLGLAGTLARMYDARLRVDLSMKLLEVKGTTDAEKAEGLPVVKDVLGGQLVAFITKQNPPTTE